MTGLVGDVGDRVKLNDGRRRPSCTRKTGRLVCTPEVLVPRVVHLEGDPLCGRYVPTTGPLRGGLCDTEGVSPRLVKLAVLTF